MNRTVPARWFRINRVTTVLIALIVSLTILSAAFVIYEPVVAQTPSDDTTRVSVSSSENQGDNDSSYASISADGRYVAFDSFATNLVAGDTNKMNDIFVRDRQKGTTKRVSVRSSGEEANDRSLFPSISADGRYVVFMSDATNLVAGDTNGGDDVFVRDRQTGTTERVSVSSSENQGNSYSFGAPSISADGRYVAFESDATNLVAGGNERGNVFVRDRRAGTTEMVSVNNSGKEANTNCYSPSISADGRYVAFGTFARNLAAGDTNFKSDVYVRDRQAGTTERVSVGGSENQVYSHSGSPSISADGRYVAFESEASNLVAGDTNRGDDIFVRDRQAGTTERVSVSRSGTEGKDYSVDPSISADGRYVAFNSSASNLVAGDTNSRRDVFVRDRQAGTTERVSVSRSGTEGKAHSAGPSISADGRYVAFDSSAGILVPGDTNRSRDVFVHE